MKKLQQKLSLIKPDVFNEINPLVAHTQGTNGLFRNQ
jgi:hypothetical protein